MGRRRAISLASAAVLFGLFSSVNLRAQQTPQVPQRCQPRPKQGPATKLSIDSLQLEGVELPEGLSQEQFTATLEQRAGSGEMGWLDRVEDAARDEWRDNGYFRAVVDVHPLQDHVTASVRHVVLRIHADPGPQYRLEEVKMLDVNPGGKLIFPNQRLRDLIPLRPGEVVNVQKVNQGLQAIDKLYASHGYIDMLATPSFQVDDQQDVISLSVMLDQGPQYRVGKIVALGFGPTARKTLMSKIKSGDAFDWSVVRDFYNSDSWLMPAGASVADDIVHRDAKTDTVDLLLDFRSCPKPAKQPTANASAGGQ